MVKREELKRRLEQERDRLRRELGETVQQTGVGGRSPFEEHAGYDDETADQATETFDTELALGLEIHRRALLAEVEDALRRFEESSYGICENCGQEIEPERLQALPWARTCLRCARQSQSDRQVGK